MRVSRYALELMFGIGFKMGFLVAIIASVMLSLPKFQEKINPVLKYAGVFDLLHMSPLWAQMFIGGVALMAGALLISIVKSWFEPLMDALFWEDSLPKPK